MAKSKTPPPPDVDPNSCSLEKFRLYETRAVLSLSHSNPPIPKSSLIGLIFSLIAAILSHRQRSIQATLPRSQDRSIGALGAQRQRGPRRLLAARSQEPPPTDRRGESSHRWPHLRRKSLRHRRYSILRVSLVFFIDEIGDVCGFLLGCIKFLESYYLILVTKRKQIGTICGHAIYSIEESQLITVPHSSIQSDLANSKTELR